MFVVELAGLSFGLFVATRLKTGVKTSSSETL